MRELRKVSGIGVTCFVIPIWYGYNMITAAKKTSTGLLPFQLITLISTEIMGTILREPVQKCILFCMCNELNRSWIFIQNSKNPNNIFRLILSFNEILGLLQIPLSFLPDELL